MGDKIQNPRRIIPWAILAGGSILAIGYIAGTAALLVALPSRAVHGPDGFVNGIHMLSARLGLGWLLSPSPQGRSIAVELGLVRLGTPAVFLPLPFLSRCRSLRPGGA